MSSENQSPELQIVKANLDFTLKIYKEISGQQENVLFSPISIHTVLSMAFQGAGGETAKRFAEALMISDAKTAASGYKSVISALNSVSGVTLLMANKIFLEQKSSLLSDFEKIIIDSFRSEIELLDFKQNDQSAKAINSWVEAKTNDKIKNLINKDDLDENTRLVLVNAIYFKGNWLNKFDADLTQTEKFYLNENDSIDVNMMHMNDKEFNYKLDDDLDAQILELPYTNENLSMIIILPNKRDGIKDLENKLSQVDFVNVTDGMYKTKVEVSLPKFKIEQTIDLENTLTNVGLGEIFDREKANFKQMIQLQPAENLYVSKVVQKAFIEVNEEGAEAAAATAMIMGVCMCSLPMPNPQFNADHPFIYYIIEKKNFVLFAGRLNEP